jgi:DNA-binding response OmpR family regulator
MTAFDVIFIDDEVSLTEIFQHYVLSKYKNWRFQAFSNATMAYNEILNDHLSAVVWIVDLMMPGKNGAQIANAIRQKHGRQPVVLAYTALDRQDIQRQDAYRDSLCQFDQIINKMDDPVSLLSLVDVWIERQEQERQNHAISSLWTQKVDGQRNRLRHVGDGRLERIG